ncbi:hypothetical protein [Roseivirga misakiensis]|uniref:Uncharacterized protein n=1 Tax=Roseivirga misakiensis TaxID=1563681 RepID=A0A1E5T5U0_9BACT|nr:hypothetical protein [Roseivirga misakiensis]OEK06716.1 hypothetical protein BFP71_03375 [Roseivirga misakiensis]
MYPVDQNHADQGLGLAPEWITGGFSTITNLIGGSQAKKQAERDRNNLLLQQQIVGQNNEAAFKLEQLKFQNLAAQNQMKNSQMNVNTKYEGTNTSLIVGGVLLLAVGTAVAVGLSKPKEKSLNGLLETLE